MTGPVPLTINIPLEGKEHAFEEAREQHWAGRGGHGGDVSPESRLDAVLTRNAGRLAEALVTESDWGAEDFSYAARKMEAAGSPELAVLARHFRGAAEEIRKTEAMEMSMAREGALTETLAEAGIPLRRREMEMHGPQIDAGHGKTLIGREDQGRKWPSGHTGRVHEPQSGPRTTGWLSYPTQTKPVDEADDDGAIPLSQRLKVGAAELRSLAKAGTREQRARLLKVASEMEALIDSATDRENGDLNAGGDVDARAADIADKYFSGHYDDDARVDSFGDWAQRDTGDSEVVDDVNDQRDQLDLPEVPKVDDADEDQLGDKGLHADEPRGARKDRRDDSMMIHLGKARRYAGQPGRRYSADREDKFGRSAARMRAMYATEESMRESATEDLTPMLIEDLEIWRRAGFSS